mmetsp:Transcript_1054/g.1879  ORF Transcript_1054/g.1879 Transcript_1054/m.1879 type:complete len:251 (+) Transcript_1054:225-977(+)
MPIIGQLQYCTYSTLKRRTIPPCCESKKTMAGLRVAQRFLSSTASSPSCRRWYQSCTPSFLSASSSSWSDLQAAGGGTQDRPSWNDEWKRLGLGAKLVDDVRFPSNLFFVQLGFGVDQHGDRTDATKACVRAVRNAIEFNSIPGVITHIPGGRHEMLIHLKLGIPKESRVDVLEIAKVFPYGKLLPIQVELGGLEFHSGRVVEELGDSDDVGICCVACVSIGYNDDSGKGGTQDDHSGSVHKVFNTKDGY